MVTITVRYEIESIDEGWVVWRRTEDGDDVALGYPGSKARRARLFRSRADAERAIEDQRRVDQAAARRLGVDIDLQIT